MEKFILIMLVTTGVSFTFCVTSIFNPVREFLAKIHPKVEELVFCPYCMSHYIAASLLLVCNYSYDFTNILILDFLFTVFAITCITAILHYPMLRTYEPVAKVMLSRKLLKNKKHE